MASPRRRARTDFQEPDPETPPTQPLGDGPEKRALRVPAFLIHRRLREVMIAAAAVLLLLLPPLLLLPLWLPWKQSFSQWPPRASERVPPGPLPYPPLAGHSAAISNETGP